jgi:hypothetical protein
MKTGDLLLLIITFLPLTACHRLGIWPTATPLPLPTELATTPLPQGSRPGGFEAVFRSLVSIDGEKDSRCYKMYRFYPDGLALYADLACFDRSPDPGGWLELDRWFNRENREVARGDYFLLGQQIWVRIVTYNSIYETTNLRSFQGQVCQDEMVLQEPAQTYYAGIPSELSQPVLEYVRLDITEPHRDTPALWGASPMPGDHSQESCHVARFEIVKRPSIVLSGNQAEYQIQTDPGETCTLRYTAPDGVPSQAQGTGAITADSQGICQWNWEVGDLEGTATVTISIDKITQDFQIEVR